MNRENIPKLRFPGFTDAWELRKLGEVLIKNSKKNKDLLITNIESISNKTGFTKQTEQFEDYSVASEDLSNYYVILEKYFAYNPSRINVGSIAYKRCKEEISVVSPLYVSFCTNSHLDDYYLWHWFKTVVFEKQRQYLSEGGVRDTLSFFQLSQMELIVPSIEEQTQIGGFFQGVDNLITFHQRKLENLKKQKRSLLQKMFPKNDEEIPGLRFPNFTSAWKKRELGEMGETYTGLTGKSKEDFGHGKAKYITYLNVFSNEIADSRLLESVEIDVKQNEVEFGDILFTTSSETPEEVGMSSIWASQDKNIYLNSFCFGYRVRANFDIYYFAFMLRAPVIREKIKLLAQGISRYNISKTKMMEIKVCLPSLGEQTQIGELFQSVDNLITLHQRKLENLQKLKKGLLQQMFV